MSKQDAQANGIWVHTSDQGSAWLARGESNDGLSMEACLTLALRSAEDKVRDLAALKAGARDPIGLAIWLACVDGQDGQSYTWAVLPRRRGEDAARVTLTAQGALEVRWLLCLTDYFLADGELWGELAATIVGLKHNVSFDAPIVAAADECHAVVTVAGGGSRYRRRPCGGCPWKKVNKGTFPSKAFELSANTAYDMAEHPFGCHESGTEKPATCAGFLLRGAANHLGVRMATFKGEIALEEVEDGGHELYDSYRQMAVDNGVHPEHPSLVPCRDG